MKVLPTIKRYIPYKGDIEQGHRVRVLAPAEAYSAAKTHDVGLVLSVSGRWARVRFKDVFGGVDQTIEVRHLTHA